MQAVANARGGLGKATGNLAQSWVNRGNEEGGSAATEPSAGDGDVSRGKRSDDVTEEARSLVRGRISAGVFVLIQCMLFVAGFRGCGCLVQLAWKS